jgi:hypothetical protein
VWRLTVQSPVLVPCAWILLLKSPFIFLHRWILLFRFGSVRRSCRKCTPAFTLLLRSSSPQSWAPAELLPSGLGFPAQVFGLTAQSASLSVAHSPLVMVSCFISLPVFSIASRSSRSGLPPQALTVQALSTELLVQARGPALCAAISVLVA